MSDCDGAVTVVVAVFDYISGCDSGCGSAVLVPWLWQWRVVVLAVTLVEAVWLWL